MSKEKSGKKTAPKRSRFAKKTSTKSTYTSLMYKKIKKPEKKPKIWHLCRRLRASAF